MPGVILASDRISRRWQVGDEVTAGFLLVKITLPSEVLQTAALRFYKPDATDCSVRGRGRKSASQRKHQHRYLDDHEESRL